MAPDEMKEERACGLVEVKDFGKVVKQYKSGKRKKGRSSNQHTL